MRAFCALAVVGTASAELTASGSAPAVSHRRRQQDGSVIIPLDSAADDSRSAQPVNAKEPEQRKNVLLMTADDLRYLGEGSKVITPNLDWLSSKSLSLKKHYVNLASSNPSRQSVFTGRRPETTRVFDSTSSFLETGGPYVTMPELLKQHNYHAVGLGKVFEVKGGKDGQGGSGKDLDGKLAEARFWSAPVWKPSSPGYDLSPEDGSLGGTRASWKSVPDSEIAARPLPDTETAQQAASLLQKWSAYGLPNATGNFFMAVGFVRPGLPFVAPASKYDLYPDEDVPKSQAFPSEAPFAAWSDGAELVSYQNPSSAAKLWASTRLDSLTTKAVHGSGSSLMPGEVLPPKVVGQLRRGYYASVSHIDDCIGTVLAALNRTNFTHRTVTIFFSDNGVHLGEKGMWAAQSNFELALHTPLVIYVPGVTDVHDDRHVHTVGAITEHTDLFATVAELAAGIEVPECPDGPEQLKEKLCTMGRSLKRIVDAPDDTYVLSAFTAAFSQTARMYDPALPTGGSNWEQPCLAGSECMMGYSVLGKVDEKEYRYTEWIAYNAEGQLNLTAGPSPKWGLVWAVELYDHSRDASEENNLWMNPDYVTIMATMRDTLRRGPLTGGAWGPWVDATRCGSCDSTPAEETRFGVAKEILNAMQSNLASPFNFSSNSNDGTFKTSSDFWSAWLRETANKLYSGDDAKKMYFGDPK